MSGWRDQNGRTADERKTVQQAADRERFADRVRQRPLSLVKPILVALFVGILIFALISAYA